MVDSPSCSTPRQTKVRRSWLRDALVAAALAIGIAAFAPALAFAGQASTGELLFYPCTSCHPLTVDPVTGQPTTKLPNNFKGHEIVLQGHEALGRGSTGCLTCHDDPKRNPGKLKLADGTLVDIKGDIALVCYRCHEDKYKEWKAGTHGKHKPNCDAAGCHDPHTPQFMYAEPLRPFVGNGWQFKVLSGRAPFEALMGPAPAPAVRYPGWFVGVAVLGFATAGGLTITLVSGRSKR